jgi:ankyrin repeat protein
MAGFFEAASLYHQDPQPLRDLIASDADLSRSDRLGLTLLHYACREGHLAAVNDLVEAGVQLETQDRDGRTPLHLACLMAGKMTRCSGRDHVEICYYLQQEGAMTATQDKHGHTPLSYLPQHAKRIGLGVRAVDGQSALWAIEQVGKTGTTLNGPVAQSAQVRVNLYG